MLKASPNLLSLKGLHGILLAAHRRTALVHSVFCFSARRIRDF